MNTPPQTASLRTRAAILNLPFTGEEVRRKAAILRRCSGSPASDEEDFVQDMFVCLLTKADEYDPSRGTLEAFVTIVLGSWLLMELRRRRSQKAGYGVGVCSMDSTMVKYDGEVDSLGSTLTEADGRRRSRRTGSSVVDLVEYLEAVHEIDAVMTDAERRLMKDVVDLGIAGASRKHGISRRRVDNAIRSIRDRVIETRNGNGCADGGPSA